MVVPSGDTQPPSSDSLLTLTGWTAVERRSRWADVLTTELTPRSAVILLAGLMLPVAYGGPFQFEAWTPRLSILLIALPLGLLALAELVAAKDIGAWSATAIVAVGAASLVANEIGPAAWRGFANRELTLLIVGSSVSLWAIGRTATVEIRETLERILLFAFSIVGMVGAAQVIMQPDSGSFALVYSRPTGMSPNPVSFGVAMAMATALLTTRCTATIRLVGVFAFVALVNASGSRVALGAALLSVLVAAARTRPVAAAAKIVGSAALGIIVANVALSSLPGGASSTQRIATAGGLSARTDAWSLGLRAFLDRPILGAGVGQYRPAIQGHFDRAFVRSYVQTDGIRAWHDAHGLPFEVLATMGATGFIAVVAFSWWSLRTSRGPLGAVALAGSLSWLLEPMHLATMPLIFLVLGASTVTATPVEDRSPSRRSIIALGVGALLALGLVVSDLRLRAALDHGDATDVAQAARPFPLDPEVSTLVARRFLVSPDTDTGSETRTEIIDWYERSIAAEPERTLWRNMLAGFYLTFRGSDPVAARDTLEESLAIQPLDPRSWELMYDAAVQLDDQALMTEAAANVCALRSSDNRPPYCD